MTKGRVYTLGPKWAKHVPAAGGALVTMPALVIDAPPRVPGTIAPIVLTPVKR